MSIFSAIRDAIFGSKAHAGEATAEAKADAVIVASASGAAPQTTAASSIDAVNAAAKAAAAAAAATSSAPAAKPAAAMPKVDVAAILDEIESDEDLDWRKSIVDLMKLLNLDSSLKARKALATELHYSGDMGDSAKMNVWLHKQVMTKLAENGGIVPAELRH